MDAEAYVDVLPWVLFVVIDRKTGLGMAWAGGCSAVCAAGMVAWSLWTGRRSVTSWVALVLFSAFFAYGMAIGTDPQYTTAFRAVALGVLAATAFLSLRSTPLSCTYTTRHVRPAVQEDPGFDRVNAEITTGWGVAALVVAATYLIPLLSQTTVAYTFSDWVVPLGIAAMTIMWTARRWERFRVQAQAEAATQAAARHPLAAVIDDGSAQQADDAAIHVIGQRRRRNA